MFFPRYIRAIREGAGALALYGLMASPTFAQTTPVTVPPIAEVDPSVTRDTTPELPHFNIYRPTDLKAQLKPMPVIAWANGGCMPWDGLWIRLFNRWAAAGYVVVTYSNMDELKNMYGPQAGQVPASGANRPASPLAAQTSPDAMKQIMKALGAITKATEDKQEQAIDWAIHANQKKSDPFYGRLDTKRIVAAGNSCGGITSLGIATHDKRIKSIFILSGGSLPPGVSTAQHEAIMKKITAPTIIIVGGREDIAHMPAGVDFSLLPATTPGVMVYRSSGTHEFISMDPKVQPIAAEIGLEWFRATLYHDKSAAKELTTQICPDCDGATWSVDSRHFFGSH